MLEYLKGKVARKNSNSVVIETGGLGLRVTVTNSTLKDLKEECKIPTYMHIQENKWEIFGFSSEKEREAFFLLNSIRGVGPKAAISILNSLTTTDLKDIALEKQSSAKLQQVNGIGRKTANRIAVELKDKLDNMNTWQDSKKSGIPAANHDDLVKALQNLGYKPSEIQLAVNEIPSIPPSLPEAVREVLKYLGRGR